MPTKKYILLYEILFHSYRAINKTVRIKRLKIIPPLTITNNDKKIKIIELMVLLVNSKPIKLHHSFF